MKALVLGSGAREHAVAWKFSKSRRISGLYVAPGNAGTEEIGENLPTLDPLDGDAILSTCRQKRIDFVFVGSEGPLAAGVVDRLKDAGVRCFGPTAKSAQLESSKSFAKSFMTRHSIPTPEARTFSSKNEFADYVRSRNRRVVVKQSGLAGGKGVLDSGSVDELIDFGTRILKSDSLVVEDWVSGNELSIFALTDGTHWLMLPPCADFKKEQEGDAGLNTGGMGAVCPVPSVDEALTATIRQRIVAPTFAGMQADGLAYQGVLYFGLMITETGPQLLEYNVRFGDPEAQVLLPLIESDFANLMDAVSDEKLDQFPLRLSDASSLGVVIASEGYPRTHKSGVSVQSLPTFPESEVLLFQAATHKDAHGRTVTTGGRCFTVVGLGSNLLNANVRAYAAVEKVVFEGAWFRRDIGKKFFID